MNRNLVALLALIFIELFTNIGVFEEGNPQPLTKILVRACNLEGFFTEIHEFMPHNSS